MANWILYTEDAVAELYNTGTGAVAGLDDTGATGTAPKVADRDHASVWWPGGTTNRDLKANLGSAKTIEAFAMGGHNLSGKAITLYQSATFGALTTSRASYTPSADDDFLVTFSGQSSQFWTWRLGTSSATTYVGTCSLLTTAGKLTFDGTNTPLLSIVSDVSPGYGSITLANGTEITQVVGAIGQVLELTWPTLDLSPTGVGSSLVALYKASNGFRKGLWITDDSFSSPGFAYYCAAQPGKGLQVRRTMAGALGPAALSLRLISKGLVVG